MASSYYKLDVTSRQEIRSKAVKALRKKGMIPGVLYFSGEENVNISIEKSVLFHAMQSGQRIFEIDQDGKSQYTMIKQLQYHPVTDEVIHVDLLRVRRSEKVTISVPLVLVGDSIGVKEGGVLSQSLNQIEISCFPTDVPEQVELNIEDLELNSAKSVADLEIDIEDLDIVTDPSLNIVSITPPVTEEEIVEDVEDVEDAQEGDVPLEGASKDEDDNSSDDNNSGQSENS